MLNIIFFRPHLYMGAIFITLCPLFAIASEDHKPHSPHVHGIGNLDIAIDGKVLKMQLRSPGADLVGFEHQAKSLADRKAVHEAEDKLLKASALFNFSEAAKCKNISAKMLYDTDNHHRTKLGHHEHKDHDEKHDKYKEHGEKHDRHKDHAEHKNEIHSEFRAMYVFTCEGIKKLLWMRTLYFKSFPKARKLNVRIISEIGQRAQTLNSDVPQLSFK
ncbi:MAG: hypothetical protein CBB68_13530 [Rhodospirillaceae bacterium TMED8]|nr:hypothetical protein [Magnetovibrio sp.]OUT48582.1 MAG: hypothetical protein CBB68_13530 [Rhodospirillaceae bacterium TMED8]